MKALFKSYKDRSIPLLFSVSITWWVLESFMGELPFPSLLLVFFLHSLVFLAMIQAGKGNLRLFLFVLGTLFYFAAIIVVITTARARYGTHYLVWLAMLEPASSKISPYESATVFLVCYMFSAIVFYFSCIRDRIGILFMTGCIPLLLHTAKTTRGITLPFILFVLLFFCLLIGKNRQFITSKADSRSRNWYLAAVSGFTIIVLGLSMLLPRFPVSPKLAELDSVVFNAIRPLLNAGGGEEGLEAEPFFIQSNSDFMQLDQAGFPTSDRILFVVQANEPLYLREQSRDTYANNQWRTGSEELTEAVPLAHVSRRPLQLNALSQVLGSMEKPDLALLDIPSPEDILTLPARPQKPSRATIWLNRVQTDFFLTTPGIFGLESATPGPEATINALGYCVPSVSGVPRIFNEYRVDYLSQDISPGSREMAVLRQMNPQIYSTFTINRLALFDKYEKALSASDFTESELMAIFFDADQEFNLAREHFSALPSDLPERFYSLAASITAGETSDYGKALALENYFHSSGFRYDLSPPRLPYNRDINDYFLFETKRGFCVHFASSMVLLARACGLPARFTEGYVCNEWDEQTGSFVVRVNDAHAFPEIYIAGAGWKVFEPTVSAEKNKDLMLFLKRLADDIRSFTQSAARLLKALPIWMKLLFIPFIVLGALYSLWLLKRLRYRVWLRKTLKADCNTGLKRIFLRLTGLFKSIGLEIKKSDTPSSYAARVLDEKGIDMKSLAEAYNRTRYGGQQASRDEVQVFLQLYQKTALQVKTLVRRPKAWFIQ